MNGSLVSFRVDEASKIKATVICEKLGIDLQTYMRMCISRLITDNGVPFGMKLAPERPLAFDELTKEQFDSAIQRAYDDIKEGKVRPVAEVEEYFNGRYGL